MHEFSIPVRVAPATPFVASIAAGASLSSAISLGSVRAAAAIVPSGATGSSLTIHASVDGLNYFPVTKNGNPLFVPMVAGTVNVLPLNELLWAPFVKVATNVAQPVAVDVIVVGS